MVIIKILTFLSYLIFIYLDFIPCGGVIRSRDGEADAVKQNIEDIAHCFD
jgi:hypothetical protein